MKKSYSHLLELAKNFRKLAQIIPGISLPGGINAEQIRPQVEAAVRLAIKNAASQKQYGILPFVEMAKKDGISVMLSFTRSDDEITVISIDMPLASPETRAKYLPKYQPVANQVKVFLEKYIEVFPTKYQGKRVDYDGFAVAFNYGYGDD